MRYAIGVDLGGTKVEAGLVTSAGLVLKTARLSTEASKGQKHVVSQIKKVIRQVWDKRVSGIGVGVPGYTDENGNVFALTNIPIWKKTNLSSILRRAYKVPVSVANDADCFTLGESRFGKGKKCKRLLGLTLGTGVGGGLVLDGKLYRAAGGVELGHILVDPSGPKDHCGMKGCLESWTSGKSLHRKYRKVTGKSSTPDEFDHPKNATARKIVKEASVKLGLGLASLVNSFNPDGVVVGGGASEIPHYVRESFAVMKKNVMRENLKVLKMVYVSKSKSALTGSAALVL